MAAVGIVFKFFKETYAKMTDFKADWDKLTEQDKADLEKGIADGTLTY